MARRGLSRDGGAFGIWWFWHAALVMVAVTCGTLLVLAVLDARAQQAVAAADAASYTPPPISVTPVPIKQTAVFIGDSYTAGAGASAQSKDWVSLVTSAEKWASRDFAYGGTGYVTTAAQGERACGASSCPNYQQVIAGTAAASPTIVFVSGGRNDVGKSDQELKAGISAFYQQLRQALPSARIYAASPIWQDTAPPSGLATIAQDVKAACASVKCTYLDLGQPLSGHPEDLASDGVHPNDQGHAAIAAAVVRTLNARK